MAKRLKCWKKDKNIYSNRKKHLAVTIDYVPRGIAETPYFVGIMERGVFIDTAYFKNKPKALSFANKYMKEHNSC